MTEHEIEAAAERDLLAAISDCDWYCRGIYRDISKATIEKIVKALQARLAAERSWREERERPIDEDFLEASGWYFTGVWWRHSLPNKRELLASRLFSKFDVLAKNVASLQFVGLGKCESRGQLLDLLAALGVDTKGGA